jgi:hypothetical protein
MNIHFNPNLSIVCKASISMEHETWIKSMGGHYPSKYCIEHCIYRKNVCVERGRGDRCVSKSN